MNWCFQTIVTGAALAAALTCPGMAQEINHAKFLAQQAALSALEGKDPLILRQSWLKGQMDPGTAKLVPQQLFKNNTYQFWFAAADPLAVLQINLYDGKGKLIEAEEMKIPGGKNVVSLRINPAASGTYYLRLAVAKETKSIQDWALIYAYR